MSVVITLSMDQLPAALRLEVAKKPIAHKRAARAAAYRLKAHLVKQVRESGIDFTGTFRGSFHATENGVDNSAPHAGIVELGCRPHPVSKEGQEAIERWCRIKLGLPEAEARSAAFAICQKIKKEGQDGHYFFRDALPYALQFYKEELERILNSMVYGSNK